MKYKENTKRTYKKRKETRYDGMPELAQEFMREMATRRSQTSADALPKRLRPLWSWLEEVGLDFSTIYKKQLATFPEWLASKYLTSRNSPPSQTTQRNILQAVKLWFAWLEENGHRNDNPASILEKPKTPPQKETEVLHPLIEDYLTFLCLKKREGTAKIAREALRRFEYWCVDNNYNLLVVTKKDIESHLVYLVTEYRTPAGKPLARTTVGQRLANIKSWYQWLEQRDHVMVNPAAQVNIRVPRSRLVVKEYLTQQEAIALIHTQVGLVEESAITKNIVWAKRLRNLTAISLALATGRRVGGLENMLITNLDCDRHELRVEREKGRTGRVLPVAEWAMEVVKEYIKDARPLLLPKNSTDLWLFPNSAGTEPLSYGGFKNFLAELLQTTIEKNEDLIDLAKKTITWHSLRVSFATLLFSNDCPIRTVNELMLHRSLSTTAKYTPIPIEDMRSIFRTAHPRA